MFNKMTEVKNEEVKIVRGDDGDAKATAASSTTSVQRLKCDKCSKMFVHVCACDWECATHCGKCKTVACPACQEGNFRDICHWCNVSIESLATGRTCHCAPQNDGAPKQGVYCGTCADDRQRKNPPRAANNPYLKLDDALAKWREQVAVWSERFPTSEVKPKFVWTRP